MIFVCAQARGFSAPDDDADQAALQEAADPAARPDVGELRWYLGFGESRGRMIKGPFSPNPTIEKSKVKVAGAVSDEEKAKARMAEMEAAMKARETKPKAGLGGGAGGKTGITARMAKAGASAGFVPANIKNVVNAQAAQRAATKAPAARVAPKSRALQNLEKTQKSHPSETGEGQ